MLLFSCSSDDDSTKVNDGTGNGGENTDIDENQGTEVGGEPEYEGYTIVWEDNFDGTSLDGTKWTAELNGNGNGNAELQYYRAANISVGPDEDSGRNCLIITARRESYGWASFTSGRLKTEGNFEFTYGRAEAAIKFPKTANGLWPAFWLLGADYSVNGWPSCGEIDIVEMGNATGISSGRQEYYFNGACHWGYYENGSYPNYAKSSYARYSIQDGEFHLFTLVWDESSIKMYLDQDVDPDVSPYYEMSITMSDESNGWDVGHYFHKDFFILFDLAVGGNFTGILNASGITALPNDGDEAYMYVDYVRVYQKE